MALTLPQVAAIAEQISVRIDGQAPGSGVLLAKQGTTYFVLTAAHVVATPDEYDIIAPDGQKYRVNYPQVKKLPGADLAVVPFTSTRSYQVAKLGNSSQVQRGAATFVAGWPAGSSAITAPTLLFQQGIISASSQVPQADGYGLIYNSNTLPGMSGGPVLNSQGELIGIHGKGDTERSGTQATANSGVVVKTGFNLGVPINTFLTLATKAGLSLPQVTTAVATIKPQASSAQASRIDDFIAEGSNKIRQGDYTAALAALDKAIAVDPNAADAYRMRTDARMGTIGWTHVAMKAERNRAVVAAALTDIDRAIQINPSLSDAWALRSTIRQATGDDKGAFADIEEAIRLSPNAGFPYIIRANVNANQGNWRATIADATQGLKLEPNSPFAGWAYNARGTALFRLNDFQASIQDLTQALRLNPKVPAIYINRGHARASAGDLQGGMADMQKGADLAIEQNEQEIHAVAVRGMQRIRSMMR
jgi:tetratricopeptide (TPR) repeat protein